MARLLVGTRYFDGLASQALLESEYERLVEQAHHLVFPGWRLVPFKCDVESEFGCKRPDYALIDPLYRAWWVVEIELAHHSLDGHVIPQVEVFRSGRYGAEHADRLIDRAPDLDRSRLLDLMRGAPPRVLVVVNLPCPEWVRPLRERDALLTIVEVFRSDLAEHALRVNGEQPRTPDDVLTVCRRVELLQRLLVVESPGGLGGAHLDRFEIDHDGLEATWVRFDMADRVCLSPLRGDPLPGVRSIEIVRLPDGRLGFQNPRRA